MYGKDYLKIILVKHMDAFEMGKLLKDEGKFDIVIDKGTIDSVNVIVICL